MKPLCASPLNTEAWRIRLFYRSLMLLVTLLAALPLLAACGAAKATADITITESGCTAPSFLLPADREPVITVENRSAERMVFTLPTMNRWVALGENEQAEFELPRYIMGSFDFFCLTEAAHTTAAGGNPFLCVMEPAELAPVARSRGMFEISQHNRLQEEVLEATPAP
jgi:hypothetical protein